MSSLGRVVAIGGGHGLARTLRALQTTAEEITAVVTVADDGGSSGRLRADYENLPPGDLRMALAALARAPERAALLQHRFAGGELDGHAVGNILLLGLLAVHDGDVVAALGDAVRLVDAAGAVLPCTTLPIDLEATTSGGVVRGQATIARTTGIEQVRILPGNPEATPEAVAAIDEADLVVLGPGSLFTSILPNLLVPGIGQALASSPAMVVLVCNLREQRGETQGLGLVEHVAAIRRHVRGLHIDLLVADDSADSLPAPTSAEVGTGVMLASVRGQDGGHDPERLAVALLRASERAT